MDRFQAASHFVTSSYKRLAAFLIIGGLLLAVPITMSVVSNQQDIRQRASVAEGESQSLDESPIQTKSVTISDPVVMAGRVVRTVTIVTENSSGAENVAEQYFLINYQGVNEGHWRGFIGWSNHGFQKYWNNSYKAGTTPLNCFNDNGSTSNVAGQGAQFSGYGAEYIDLKACYTKTDENNVRTTRFDIWINPNFTAPTDNTLSGFSENAAQANTGWQPFLPTFTVSPQSTPTLVPTNAATPIPTSTAGTGCVMIPACVYPPSNPTCGVVEPTQGFCPAPTGTNILVQVQLDGIGVADIQGINRNPQRPTRSVAVRYVSPSGVITEQSGQVKYNPQTGIYSGYISATNLPAGPYNIKVKMDNTLWKQLPGIQNLLADRIIATPLVTLIAGDFNQDNVLNILDYNLLLSCTRDGQCGRVSQKQIEKYIAAFKEILKAEI